MSPEYGQYIAEAFQEYLKTGDSGLIEKFSAKELKMAISHLSPYYGNNKQWYRQLENRLEELNYINEAKTERVKSSLLRWKKEWLGEILAFGLGVMLGLVF